MKLIDQVIDRVDDWQQRHTPSAFVFGVVKKYGDDRGGHLAALITYYGFLSIFPLLLVFVTVLGFFLHDNASLRHDLLDSALADFPDHRCAAETERARAGRERNRPPRRDRRPDLGLARRRPGRAARHGRGVERADQGAPELLRPPAPARLLILVVLAVAIVATTVLASAATLVPESPIVTVLTVILTVAINVGLYLLAFRVLSPKSIATRDLRTGAVVGGVLWTALQTLGSWLVARQLRHTSELYGFFGIVLGLLFFLFLASQIMVYAAEVNVVLARRLWPRSVRPPPLTEADEQALTDSAIAEERRPEEHVEVVFDNATHDR